MTSHSTAHGPTRRRLDRRLVALLTAALAVFLAETFLRINGLLPPFGGEVLFGLGVTSAVGGTILLAFTGPAATAEAEQAAAPSTGAETADTADVPDKTSKRGAVVARPAFGEF